MLNQKILSLLFLSIVFAVSSLAQSPVITGKVMDIDTQKPLEGVAIVLAGTENIYTSTKADGTFSLEAKGRKNGTAASLDFIYKGYKQAFMQIGSAVILGDKSATNLKIDMTQQEAKQFDALLLAYQKILEQKIQAVQTQIAALPAGDRKRVQLQDSIYITCNAAESESVSLPELLNTTMEILRRPLSAVGLRAKTQWNEGNLDAAILLLENAKVMENWQKTTKTVAPATNIAYNDAVLLAVFTDLNRHSDTKKSLALYENLFAADTTNTEAAALLGGQYVVEEETEKALRCFDVVVRRTTSDLLKVTYMSLSLILKNKGTLTDENLKNKKNSIKNKLKNTEVTLQNIQTIMKNSRKGNDESTALYKADLFLQAGLMSLLLTEEKPHIDFLTAYGKDLSKQFLPCGHHRYIYDVLGLFKWLYADDTNKYMAAVDELSDYYGDCAKKSPYFMHIKQQLAILKVKQNSIAMIKAGFRETEVVYTQRIAAEHILAQRFPLICRNAEMNLHNDFTTFASGKEQQAMVQKTYLNAINAYNTAVQTNYAAYATPFLRIIGNFDDITKDSTKLRIYPKQIAFFEPLAAKNNINFQPLLTEFYLYYGDVLAKDSLRKAEAATAYEKSVASAAALYDAYPQSFGGNLNATCGTTARFYEREKQIDKAIATYNTMIEKTKKTYDKAHKDNEYYLLYAYNNLIKVYKETLYYKENLDYRKKSKTILAEMERIMTETGLDLPALYKQIEEDKYEGDEEEETVESFTNAVSLHKDFFEKTTSADALLIGRLSDLRTKLDSAKIEDRHAECVTLLNEDIKITTTLAKNIKYNNDFERQAADANGSLSWQHLFTKQYAEAEAAAKNAIAYKNPKTSEQPGEWANTNLALAYILQDKYSDALKIYKKYKGKMYGATDANWTQTFLEDLDSLEKEGVTHKDFEKARKYLKK
jgi:hypothetical protein